MSISIVSSYAVSVYLYSLPLVWANFLLRMTAHGKELVLPDVVFGVGCAVVLYQVLFRQFGLELRLFRHRCGVSSCFA